MKDYDNYLAESARGFGLNFSLVSFTLANIYFELSDWCSSFE